MLIYNIFNMLLYISTWNLSLERNFWRLLVLNNGLSVHGRWSNPCSMHVQWFNDAIHSLETRTGVAVWSKNLLSSHMLLGLIPQYDTLGISYNRPRLTKLMSAFDDNWKKLAREKERISASFFHGMVVKNECCSHTSCYFSRIFSKYRPGNGKRTSGEDIPIIENL